MRNRGVQVCLYWRYFPSPHFRIRIRIIIIILEADIHRKGNHVPMVTNYLIHTLAGLGHEMRGNCQDIQLVPIVAHFRAVNYYDCHLIKASTATN